MTDREQCFDIYATSFIDEDGDFKYHLFDTCFKYCKFLKVGDKVVSILFLLPCEIVRFGRRIKAYYIYAAATAQDERGKGYMGKLLKKIKSETKDVLFLRPGEKYLITYYTKFGFVSTTSKKIKNPNCFAVPKDEFLKLAEYEIVDTSASSFTLMYYSREDSSFKNLSFQYTME